MSFGFSRREFHVQFFGAAVFGSFCSQKLEQDTGDRDLLLFDGWILKRSDIVELLASERIVNSKSTIL